MASPELLAGGTRQVAPGLSGVVYGFLRLEDDTLLLPNPGEAMRLLGFVAAFVAVGLQSSVRAEPMATGLDFPMLTGRVVDAQTGQPIAGARVEIPEDGTEFTTGTDGLFKLGRRISDPRIFVVRAQAYAPFSATGWGKDKPLEFRLERSSPGMIVLDDRVRRLGDNESDAPGHDFKLQAEGLMQVYDFTLPANQSSIPDSYILRINSLLGIDSPESSDTNQSPYALLRKLGDKHQYWGVLVLCNNQLIGHIVYNLDRIDLSIPPGLLKPGDNKIVITSTIQLKQSYVKLSDSGRWLVRRLSATQFDGSLVYADDFDDVEYAGVLLLRQPAAKSNP